MIGRNKTIGTDKSRRLSKQTIKSALYQTELFSHNPEGLISKALFPRYVSNHNFTFLRGKYSTDIELCTCTVYVMQVFVIERIQVLCMGKTKEI